MTTLTYPFREADVRALRAGDAVSLNGTIWTGRDRFHKHFADGGRLPVDFRDGALYHCGPVVVKSETGKVKGEGWKVVAGGPTTSVRENAYEPDFIAKTGVRLIIGKGGMDERALEACRRHGAVYLQAVGGAAAVTAHAIARVANVYFLDEFGAAEACWEFEVRDFRCVVAMDSHGVSLFARVAAESRRRLNALMP
jgi:fumarate hydratase class I